MALWMRAGRWAEAQAEANALREKVHAVAAGKRSRAEEAEDSTALSEVEWILSLSAAVQRKEQRIAISLSPLVGEEEEKGEALAQRVVATCHEVVQLCRSLVRSGVDVALHYAQALSAHQQAMAAVSSSTSSDSSLLSSHSPSSPRSQAAHISSRLRFSVYSYHLSTLVTSYLPWLVRMAREEAEVDGLIQRAESSLAMSSAALSGMEGRERGGCVGLLALLEGQLRMQCGADAKVVMGVLRGGLQPPDDMAGTWAGVVRERLLRQMQDTAAVLLREKEMEGGVKEERGEEGSGGEREREWVVEQLTRVRSWCRVHPQEVEEERGFLQGGVWLLENGDEGEGEAQEEEHEGERKEKEAETESMQVEGEEAEQEEEGAEGGPSDESADDGEWGQRRRQSVPAGSRRRGRRQQSPTPLCPSPPASPPTHYDVDDDDEGDVLLAEKTAQVRSQRLSRQLPRPTTRPPRKRRTVSQRSKRGEREAGSSTDDGADWIIEDRYEVKSTRPKPHPHLRTLAAPSRRSTRVVHPTGLTAFTRQQMLDMQAQRMKAQGGAVAMEEGERVVPLAASSPSRVSPVRASLSMNDLSDSDATTTEVEDRGVGRATQRQSHSLPLSVVGQDLPPSLSFRHTLDVVVDGVSHSLPLSPLIPAARDPTRRLRDEDLQGLSLSAVTAHLALHLHRQVGRVCAVRRVTVGGEEVSPDATALALFPPSGQAVEVEVEWRATSMWECFHSLCSMRALPCHPSIEGVIHPHGVDAEVSFPSPSPTLTSSALLPFLLSLRVEAATLTSLSLPPIPLTSDAVDAFTDVITCLHFPSSPLSLRRAYPLPSHLLPLTLLPPPVVPPAALSRLSCIRLSHVLLSSHCLSRVLSSLALLPSLTSVDVAYSPLTDLCLPSLTVLLTHCSTLSHLSLRSTPLTGRTPHLHLFTAALHSHPSLTSLDLSHSALTCEAMTAVLPGLIRLSVLRVGGGRVRGDVLRRFLQGVGRTERGCGMRLSLDEVEAVREDTVWWDLLYLVTGGDGGGGGPSRVREVSVRGCPLDAAKRAMVRALNAGGRTALLVF